MLLSTGDQAEDLDAAEPTPLAPQPSGNFKEYVAEKKAEAKPTNTWPSKDILTLTKDLFAYGKSVGKTDGQIGKSLVARYGSMDLSTWTNQQLDEAADRLLAAQAKEAKGVEQ